MRLGDVANAGAAAAGKPLDGVRILALEQMQALPYATQLLARLGADVVKVENPSGGDLGRGSQPAMTDPEGRSVGATFLRNNLGKRSICIDLKSPAGRDLVLQLAPRFDVVAENSKAGAMARLGLGYADIAAVHPRAIYLSVSGFGNTVPSPYDAWPAFAPIVEAMSGIYEFKRRGDQPAGGRARRRARRHRLRALRRDRGAGRPAPPGRHGGGPARRHRDARRDGRDDRHRHQLLVPRTAGRGDGGADHGRVPGRRRLVHRPGRPGGRSSRCSPSWSANPAGPPIRASRTAKGGSITSTT